MIMSLYALAAGLGGNLIPLHFQGTKYSPLFLCIFIGQWLLA